MSMRSWRNPSVSSPMMRRRTNPFGSITHVSGTFATPNATEIAPSSSFTFGQSPPFAEKNASTASSLSSFTTVYSSTGSSADCCAAAKATSWGCSLRQGTHVELKKFSTTQLPLRRERSNCPPSSVADRTAGAGRPSNGDSAVSPSPGSASASTASSPTRTAPTAAAINGERRCVTAPPPPAPVRTQGRWAYGAGPGTSREPCPRP